MQIAKLQAYLVLYVGHELIVEFFGELYCRIKTLHHRGLYYVEQSTDRSE